MSDVTTEKTDDPGEPATSEAVQDPPMPGPRRRSWPKIVLFSVLGLLLSLVLAVVVVGFFVDLGFLVQKQVMAALPEAQKKLGREVSVGRVRLKLLPTVHLRISDLKIHGQPGQTGVLAQPLVYISEVEAKVKVWSALLTLGRYLTVSDVLISGGKIQVARLSGGRLSYEDVLDKLAEQPKDDTPLSPEQIDRLAGITIAHAALSQSAVWLYDLSAGPTAAPLKIDAIHFELHDARLFGESRATLDMALFQLVPNFHVELALGPLPPDLKPVPAWSVLRRLQVKLQPFQLEPLLQFLPRPTGTSIERAMVEVDLTLTSPKDSGKLSLTTKSGLRALQLRQFGTPEKLYSLSKGSPTDVMLAVSLEAAMLSGDIRVDRARLDIGNMNITTKADLRNLWKNPAVHSLEVVSQGLRLERLLALLPKTALPGDAVLQGPLSLTGSASGTPTAAAVKVGLDLSEAKLLLPALHKPPGMPLQLGLQGVLKDTAFQLDRFGLTLGPLSLLLSGQVKSGADFDLTLDSGTVDLDKLLRLLPSVNEGLAGGKKKKGPTIDGDLRLSGAVSKKGETFLARANVKMQNANFAQPGADLSGHAEFSAEVKQTPSQANVEAKLDLTRAALHVAGSVDKDQGVPMQLTLSAQKTPSVVQIKQAALELPGGVIRLLGSADLAKKQLDVKVPLCDLDLSKLSRVVPSLRDMAGGGLLDSKLSFGASARGNPDELGQGRAQLDGFKMQVAGGTIVGSASVRGLDEPRQANFDFSADYLDLDKLIGDKKGDDDDAPSREFQTPQLLKRLQAEGKIKVAAGKLRGQNMRDFVLEMTLSGGKLVFRVLRLQALGGSVLLSGTSVDFAPSRPRFSVKAKLDKVAVHEAVSLKSKDLAKKVQGYGSMDLSADGQGLRWEDIAPRLAGLLDLGFSDGKLTTAKLGSQVIGPLVQRLGIGNSGDDRDMSLKNLSAQFRIADGRMNTTRPLVYQSEQGTVKLTGSIGLDKTLDLLGDLALQPQVISALSGGRITPAAPVPVALRITGSIDEPKFQLVDPVKTAAALAAAIAKGRGQEFLNRAGGGVLGNVLSGAGTTGGGAKLPANLPTSLPTNLPTSLPTNVPSNAPNGQPGQPGVNQQLQNAKQRLQQGGGLPGLFRR